MKLAFQIPILEMFIPSPFTEGFGPWETEFRRLWKPNALPRASQRLPNIKEVHEIAGWANRAVPWYIRVL